MISRKASKIMVKDRKLITSGYDRNIATQVGNVCFGELFLAMHRGSVGMFQR